MKAIAVPQITERLHLINKISCVEKTTLENDKLTYVS